MPLVSVTAPRGKGHITAEKKNKTKHNQPTPHQKWTEFQQVTPSLYVQKVLPKQILNAEQWEKIQEKEQ